MAKGNHYRVEHDGQVFQRKSANRSYSHVVLRPISLARNLQYAEDAARYDWKHNHDYHREFVDGTSRFLVRNAWESEEQHAQDSAREIERSKAWIALGLDGLIRQTRERAEQAWRRDFPCGREEAWCYVGWTGRHDLALKVAKPGDVILEAVKVG